MTIIGNVIWFVFYGGFFMWIFWLIAALVMFLSIVGIPFGRACYNLSELAAAPVGREAIDRSELTQRKDIGTSGWGLLGNIVWFLTFGWLLAVMHVLAGIFAFITIIGIPFGIQHFKLAGISLMPIGKAVVAKELAQEAKQANAKQNLEKLRNGMAVSNIADYNEQFGAPFSANTGSGIELTHIGHAGNAASTYAHNAGSHSNPVAAQASSNGARAYVALAVLVLVGFAAFVLHGFLEKREEVISSIYESLDSATAQIESEHPICAHLDTSITSEMMECLGLRYETADSELNKVYKQVMAGLNTEQKQALKAKQISWIKAKERECPKAGQEFEGGSLESVLISECFTVRTEQKLKELKALL